MNVKFHCFKNYAAAAGTTDEREMYRLLQSRPDLKAMRYEMTTFCNEVIDRTLYFGCTNFAGDFLLALDIDSGEIRSCGYPGIREENEHKIHRGLWYDREMNCLVFATSTLSPLSKLYRAPGSKVSLYHLDSGELEVIGRNEPGQYTQATVYDPQRKLLYMFNYRAFKFGVFDVKKRVMRHNAFIESIPHISALDDKGRCWATYGHKQQWLRFNPEKDDYEWFDTAMETAVKGADVMYQGAGPVDGMINGGDGYIYVGTACCELYRLDPETAEAEYLGKPLTLNRLPGLTIGEDGTLFGVGGDKGEAYLIRYDRETGAFKVFGPLEAPDGTRLYRPHDIIAHEGRFFAAETDVPNRSGFIWEIEI